MTKSPEEVDPEKAPALAAMQALKFDEDDPNGVLNLITDNPCSWHKATGTPAGALHPLKTFL
jgi:hypothetical protein